MKGQDKFVILSNQRSGSTAIRLILNEHKEIRCHDEVFLKSSFAKDAISHFVKLKGLEKKYKLFDYYGSNIFMKKLLYKHVLYNDSLSHANNKFTSTLLNDFMESLFNNSNHCAPWTSIKTWNDFSKIIDHESFKCVGLKIMYYELNNNWLQSRLLSGDFKIIHLVRHNKLERLISSKIAKTRNNWHSERKVDKIKVKLHTVGLIERIRNEIAEDEQFEKLFSSKNYLKVFYEDFRSDPGEFLNQLCAFLGVSNLNSETSLKKISGSPKDVLENYYEVESILKNTEFSKFL